MGHILLAARAKVNLTLDILGRRPDGYHEIESLMQSVDLADTVRISHGGPGIEILSDSPDVPADSTNLAAKAALALATSCGARLGARIQIRKRIPVAAGLAGGSADAAATLLGLNELWGLGLTTGQLVEIGARVGADVPFCLTGGTAVARGKGELIEQLPPLEGVWFVIVVPRIKVSTADVYRQFDDLPTTRRSSTARATDSIWAGDIEGLAKALGNSLEAVTARRNPEIARIKEILLARGALGSVMSGSGPAVVGLVRSRDSALRICKEISSSQIAGAFATGARVFVCSTATAGVRVEERECAGRGEELAWWVR
ncbi:MAG TPA: 4-(cytidine 5'-diphospho)-2-C-methyl-D-erythritol kinase [Firmicutes bacterium]|nr:4-(cytidine 5'-diphospho)-2-C-methyl-D-erythritol kinase [Bacillota bacterium]